MEVPFADGLYGIGECKDVMMSYLACMKKVKGLNNHECRILAKSYLACRMDR
jgi:cytochrome c oxidase assembly protein subunit 19